MADTTSVNPRGLPRLDIGRDVNGRFRKNNPGGPGNPFARKVAALRKALLDSVSEQDLKDVIEILKEQARLGDMAAIKLIFQYCVGKPEPVKDPDRMDIDEWDRLQQMRVSEQQYKKTTESIPACVACHRAQFGWPCSIQEGDGPVQHSIFRIYEDLKASGQSSTQPSSLPQPAPQQPGTVVATQTSEANTPTESPVANPERPSSATETSKSNDRRERQGGTRRERRARTQAPLPNGEIDWEHMSTLELSRLLYPPAQPSAPPDDKPPKG